MGYIYKGKIHDVEPQPAPVRAVSTPGPKPKPRGFDPSLCGTYAGYKQHERAGTEKCQPCKDANAAYSRDYQARRRAGLGLVRGFRPDQCGTYRGYCHHQRHKVPACGPCREASRLHTAKHRANRKAA
jgi:hypothetical protein